MKKLVNVFWILKCLHISFRYTQIQHRREGGRVERRNVPPPEIGKIVLEIWCYLPEIYTFGAEPEIQEIYSKKIVKKVNFP